MEPALVTIKQLSEYPGSTSSLIHFYKRSQEPICVQDGDLLSTPDPHHATSITEVELYSGVFSSISSTALVASGQYGGPIISLDKGVVTIFTSSGEQISAWKWSNSPALAAGWSDTEEALFVLEDGTVLIYSMFGIFKSTFSMGQEAKDIKILSAKIFSSHSGIGVAVLTTTHRFYLVSSTTEPTVRKLYDCGELPSPWGWTPLAYDRQSKLVVGRGNEVLLLSHNNCVRHYKVEMPPTTNQLTSLFRPVLMDRLIARRLFPLALEISEFLKLSSVGRSRVLAHWTIYKVETSTSEEGETARQVSSRLELSSDIPYSDIAEKAAECGKKQLAVQLLEHEVRADKQVPLLLKLGQGAPALRKAIYSGDTDLIYHVILALQDQHSTYHNDMHKLSHLSQHENDEADRSNNVVIYKDLEISTLRLLKHE